MRFLRVVVAAAVGAILLVATMSAPALAHEPGTTAILLQVGADEVTVRLDIPLDQLEAALDAEVPTDRLGLSSSRETLVEYVTGHLLVSGDDGAGWAEAANLLTIVTIDGASHLRVILTVEPAGAVPPTFTIAYDGVLEHDATHEIYLTALSEADEADGAGVVGVIDRDISELVVGLENVDDVAATFTTMAGQGFRHVLDGADHLLFLLVLLLPAPLAASAGRWSKASNGRHALRKVAHVATAFTLGHSITLAASALGWVSLPGRPVEILVGLSVAVAALHAIRPIAMRGEVAIAGGFGLIHGLAFSGLLDDLGLAQTTSLVSLLGFNIGIEAAQLAVIACSFPSLWMLSHTQSFTAVRTVGASVALVASGAWIVERLEIAANPFALIEVAVIEHLGVGAAALGGLAAIVWSVDRRRRVERPSVATA